MMYSWYTLFLIFFGKINTVDSESVQIVILARSRAHTLPIWLGFIEDLDYPKSDITVFIQTGKLRTGACI